MLRLCTEGPLANLQHPRYCQPAIFVAGLAGMELLRCIREEAVASPACLEFPGERGERGGLVARNGLQCALALVACDA